MYLLYRENFHMPERNYQDRENNVQNLNYPNVCKKYDNLMKEILTLFYYYLFLAYF